MANYKKNNEKTPGGGDYSEIYFFDTDNKPTDEKKAVRCVIRECTKNGELLKETWATVKTIRGRFRQSGDGSMIDKGELF